MPHPDDMLAVAGELMRDGSVISNKRGSGSTTPSMGSITNRNTAFNRGFLGRRKTLKDMKKAFHRTKGR